MLYQRILTAIPLAAFVFWIIFYQPTEIFFYFVLFIVLIAAYEWAKLSAVKNIVFRCVFSIVLTAMVWGVQQYFSNITVWFIYVAVMWWFSITYYLKSAKPTSVANYSHANLRIDKLFAAFMVLPAAAFSMQLTHTMWQGADWLFYALLLVWVADTGAYFAGKKFGKHKLAPNISPGKTKEGLFGAVIATSIYTLISSYYFELDTDTAALLILLAIILTFISVSGDLYFSFLKREAGLKDSGNILPGHGGILDRIDSILAALPVFYLGYIWLIRSDLLNSGVFNIS